MILRNCSRSLHKEQSGVLVFSPLRLSPAAQPALPQKLFCYTVETSHPPFRSPPGNHTFFLLPADFPYGHFPDIPPASSFLSKKGRGFDKVSTFFIQQKNNHVPVTFLKFNARFFLFLSVGGFLNLRWLQ